MTDQSNEDPTDVSSLFREERAGLVRLAFLLTSSSMVAEEIVQDAFERLQRRWGHVDSPGAYLRRSVVNGANSYHRRRAVERKHPAEPLPAVLPPEIDEMWDLIQRLSPKRRTVLVLRFYEDLSVDQAAEVMGVRPGTVKSLTHRALESLRRELE